MRSALEFVTVYTGGHVLFTEVRPQQIAPLMNFIEEVV